MIKDNKQAQIDRMNEQLNDLLGPKPEEVKFEEFNMMKERSLTVSAYESIGEVQLSIRATDNMLGSMNIEKVTSTRLRAYSYDLMSQRTTYNFKFEDMSIIK